jgi:hypothetical protein
MNSGFTLNGFPSMGAWLSYGLGTENDNLPAFVVLPDPRGLIAGGSINWTSGFLPANHQGVPFRTQSREPIADLNTPSPSPLPATPFRPPISSPMNREFAEANPGDSAFAARLRSYELAARMQVSIPEATRLESEPESIQRLYGIDDPSNKGFARNCLMARRLLERGVRFVQIFNGGAFGSPRINWDGHENLKENHDTQAATMDRPVAALIQDLKQRGMLEDTLFVWNTEFGRSPATQGIGLPRPRPSSHRLHLLPRRRRPQSAGIITAAPTTSGTSWPTTRSPSPTSTPPSSTCSASTTNASPSTTTASTAASPTSTARSSIPSCPPTSAFLPQR